MKLTYINLLIIIVLTSATTFFMGKLFDGWTITLVPPGQYEQLRQQTQQNQQRIQQVSQIHDNLVALLKDRKIIEEGLK